MNKIYFLSFFIFFGILETSSQEYKKIINEGSFWDESKQLGGVCDKEYSRFKIGNDTVIENKIYKKILIAPYKTTGVNNPCPQYPEPLVIDTNDFVEHNEYIRENITEKKVYIWSNKYTHYKEYTLYDFNLDVGHVMTNSYAKHGEDLTITSISHDNAGRKKYHYDNSTTFYYTEGIGSNLGIINFEAIIGEGYRELFCWGNTQNESNCAKEVLSLKETKFKNVHIYPNPAKEKIFITNFAKNLSIKIYSILGNEIDNIILEKNYIDLKKYKSGIYFLEIKTQNKKKIVQFIKK